MPKSPTVRLMQYVAVDKLDRAIRMAQAKERERLKRLNQLKRMAKYL